jgi:hypothetical protein
MGANICLNCTADYDLRPEEARLFEAAIGLADLLAALDLTDSQHHAIAEMRAFLTHLPAPPPDGFNGEFGFEFQSENDELEGGYSGAWGVSVCRGLLEIFSDGFEGRGGFSWELCPGQRNQRDLTHVGEWIEQVSAPLSILPMGQVLVVEASTWKVSAG